MRTIYGKASGFGVSSPENRGNWSPDNGGLGAKHIRFRGRYLQPLPTNRRTSPQIAASLGLVEDGLVRGRSCMPEVVRNWRSRNQMSPNLDNPPERKSYRDTALAIPHQLRIVQERIEQFLRADLVFLSLIAIGTVFVASLRLVVSLSTPSAGGDYGHYLIAANWYGGMDRSGEGPFDPPLV